MSENATHDKEEIFSKVLRAGRRTYFFDVRATKANDFYLTITESKKHDGHNGESYYKKHKIYLYKEDFERFSEIMTDVMDYIVKEKGQEVISERHNPDFKRNGFDENGYDSFEPKVKTEEAANTDEQFADSKAFTDVNFEEI